MPLDQSPQVETARRPNWEMPEVTGVKIRAAEYHPRATRNFATPLAEVKDAVEIVVTFKTPPPARAMSPVLYVGETRLTESETLDKEGKAMRFWAFDRSKLLEGAPIEVRWMGEPPPGPKTGAKASPKFVYSLPK
jgi:hypothetical protein